jgi:DNA-binding transcriptional MerR regulator
VVQEEVRRLGEDDSQWRAKEIVGEVFQSLVERFDLPATPWTLQDYIKATARGLAMKAYPSLQSHKPWIDPASGEQVYLDALVAQMYDISPRTVARWRADQGIRTRGLSAEQLRAFQQEQEEKQARKRLRRMGKERDMSADVIKKLFQRKKKPDGTPDWGAIEAHIKRRGSNAATEDTMSLEEQITALEARLAETAPGSEERAGT